MVRVEDMFAVDWWKGVLKGLLGGEGGGWQVRGVSMNDSIKV